MDVVGGVGFRAVDQYLHLSVVFCAYRRRPNSAGMMTTALTFLVLQQALTGAPIGGRNDQEPFGAGERIGKSTRVAAAVLAHHGDLTTVVSSEMPKPNRNRKVSGSTTAMIQLDGSRVTCLPSLIMIAASCCHQLRTRVSVSLMPPLLR